MLLKISRAAYTLFAESICARETPVWSGATIIIDIYDIVADYFIC